MLLLPSKSKENWLKQAQVIAKVCKKRKKKIQRTSDELCRHVSPWWLGGINWNLELNVSLPEWVSTEILVVKFHCYIRELQTQCFLTYTPICRKPALAELGCTAHYSVSWSPQKTAHFFLHTNFAFLWWFNCFNFHCACG